MFSACTVVEMDERIKSVNESLRKATKQKLKRNKFQFYYVSTIQISKTRFANIFSVRKVEQKMS